LYDFFSFSTQKVVDATRIKGKLPCHEVYDANLQGGKGSACSGKHGGVLHRAAAWLSTLVPQASHALMGTC